MKKGAKIALHLFLDWKSMRNSEVAHSWREKRKKNTCHRKRPIIFQRNVVFYTILPLPLTAHFCEWQLICYDLYFFSAQIILNAKMLRKILRLLVATQNNATKTYSWTYATNSMVLELYKQEKKICSNAKHSNIWFLCQNLNRKSKVPSNSYFSPVFFFVIGSWDLSYFDCITYFTFGTITVWPDSKMRISVLRTKHT